MSSELLSHAIILWAAIIPLAILNGLLRESLLVRALPHDAARTTSGVTLSLLVVGFATLTVGWLPATGPRVFLVVGILWLGLTIAFEFGFGHFIGRKPVRELLRAYQFRDGDIWPAVLLVVALAPWIAARLRGLI